jgi:hypothetical protein
MARLIHLKVGPATSPLYELKPTMKANRKLRIFKPATIIKTMFYFEGNPAASLLTNNGGLRQQSVMEFPKAEAALEWCRQHGATLVYSPIDLLKN